MGRKKAPDKQDPDDSPYDSAPSPDEVQDESGEFAIGGISVKPTSSNVLAAYEYEDLKRSSNSGTRVTQLLFWTVYVLFFSYIHYFIRALRWQFFSRLGVGGKMAKFFQEASENFKKLRFLQNPDRRVLYLRASRVYTPAQLLPFVPGSKPIPEDASSERPPKPRNWNTIRKQVYDRDGYTCVNCGAGGGPNGNSELHADHILPRSRDGPDTLQNLRTLCSECHQARHARNFS